MADAPDITIRRALVADRAALHRLLTKSWLRVWAPHLRASSVERFQREDPVATEIDESLQWMWVAQADGEIVGSVVVVDDHLVDLHVDFAMWGRGVGTALLEHAEAIGARRLEVRAFNRRAIRLYERRGWRHVATFEASELGTPVTTLVYRLARGSVTPS